jgi:5'(3')-deoxyribonucleotidase
MQSLIVDFDGVVTITDHIWLEYINKKYCIQTKLSDYDHNISLEKNVNILAGINLSFEEFYFDFTRNYTMSFDLHKNALPLPDSTEVIKELAKKYCLFISTARNSLGIDVIKFVLHNQGILDCFKGFHFVYSFNEKREFTKIPKAEFISSFCGKASYFIDDSHKEVEKTKNIVPSILLSNKKEVKGTWKANNWIEIGDLIL